MIDANLKDKVCVLTGGGGVLGSSLSKGMAEQGAKIAILDLHLEKAESAAKRIAEETGSKVIGVSANVLDRESIEKAAKVISAELGPADILVNAAGGNSPDATTQAEFIEESVLDNLDSTFLGLKLEGFEKVFDLNFMGTLLPTMVFTREMISRKKGSVVNISSMNSFRPLTKIPAYSAAKAAVNNFTQWLAVHYAKVGVRVNAIAPGFFLTKQNSFLLVDQESGELTPRGEKIISSTPTGAFGKPDDLVGALLYLSSDMAGFVTGIVVPVDGGFSAYSGV